MIPALENNAPSAEALLRHAAWTRRLARSLVSDDASAEDVAQEVWLSALRRPPQTAEPIEPWIRTVARNEAFNQTRERRRRQAREERADLPEAAESAEESLERVQLHKLLVDAVSDLKEPYRLMVVLRYFDGLSSVEIGARENLPAGTVRGRLKTALELLRAALDRRGGGRERWMLSLTRFSDPRARPSSPPPTTRSPRPLGNGGSILACATIVGAVAISWWLAGAPGMHRSTPVPPAGNEGGARTALDDGEAATTSHRALSPGSAMASRREAPRSALEAAQRQQVEVAGALSSSLIGRVSTSGTLAKRAAGRVGRDGALPEAVVQIVRGLAASSPLPASEVQLTLRGSHLGPRVQVGRIGQSIVVENDDDGVRSILVRQGKVTLFDRPISASSRSAAISIPRARDVIRITCREHPAEVAFVMPADNEFHAVTNEEGRFALADLPAGAYTLEAWDETLGTRTADVSTPAPARVLAISFDDEPNQGIAEDRRCRIATSGRGPIGEACVAGGIPAARRAMKDLVTQARARGQRFSCDGCHQDLDELTLTVTARDDLDKLLALVKPRGP